MLYLFTYLLIAIFIYLRIALIVLLLFLQKKIMYCTFFISLLHPFLSLSLSLCYTFFLLFCKWNLCKKLEKSLREKKKYCYSFKRYFWISQFTIFHFHLKNFVLLFFFFLKMDENESEEDGNRWLSLIPLFVYLFFFE